MKRLEDFIEEHRPEMDGAEPGEGHFERFALKLQQDADRPRSQPGRFYVLKLAAVILVLITVGVIATEFIAGSFMQRIFKTNETSHLTPELKEAIQYYNDQTLDKLGQLEILARTSPEVRKMQATVLRDLDNLDAATNDLQKSLGENPGNERLQAAIIQNQRMKESILNTILQNVTSLKTN
ncbi:MAG TPA: hypothetical protein PKN44_13015 [Bacteroidales bacterium]|nr:hypothetical protein [Bacteroidales bacterium]HPS50740.1 hypothetical protein [Bacteroidales bacterium]